MKRAWLRGATAPRGSLRDRSPLPPTGGLASLGALAICFGALGLSACTVKEEPKKTHSSGAGGAATTDGGPSEPDSGVVGTGGAGGGSSNPDAGADGGACDGATEEGVCDGTKVIFCANGKRAEVDCDAIQATCEVTNGRADCAEGNRSASCGSLTALGTCDGAVLKYCDSSGIASVPRSIDCAAYGQKCDPKGATDGGAICVPQGPCNGVTEDGTCDGNSLSFCEADELYTFDCGVDACQTTSGFADCFVTGVQDGCGTETATGRCDGQTRVSCQGGVVAREDCEMLGLECLPATGGGSRCQTPTTCATTCPSGTTCTAGRCKPTKAPTAEWTFMVYMIANNNLSRAAWQDLNEMEAVGSDSKLNIVTEVKFAPNYYSYGIDPTWLDGGVYRMKVEADSDPSDATSLGSAKRLGTFNMSDPTRLSQFVRYGVETYPAKHYALIMWNHGAGYKEAFVDNSTLMSLKDLVTGMRDSGVHLDLVGFDACLMSMHEVAYAMRGNADYMVASEEVEPGAGYPYDDVLGSLSTQPTMTPAAFGKVIVDKYSDSYVGGYRPQDTTSALIDLSKIELANEKLGAVVTALKTDLRGNRAAARSMLDQDTVLRFQQHEDADLGTTLSTFADLGNASGPASNDMLGWLKSTSNVVPYSRASGPLSKATGLAVFLPQSGSADYYGSNAIDDYKSRVDFLPMQPWTSFLTGVLGDEEPAAPQPGEGAVSSFSVVLDWASAIDGKTSNADLDLYVFEPGGDFGTPSNGTVSGSGLLSADSFDTGVPEESYTLAPVHEVGTYIVVVHFYGGPAKEVAYPTLQVIRPDLPGGSRTLLRAKLQNRELVQIPMDNSKPLEKKIDGTNFQGVVNLDYTNLWYATTIEVKK